MIINLLRIQKKQQSSLPQALFMEYLCLLHGSIEAHEGENKNEHPLPQL